MNNGIKILIALLVLIIVALAIILPIFFLKIKPSQENPPPEGTPPPPPPIEEPPVEQPPEISICPYVLTEMTTSEIKGSYSNSLKIIYDTSNYFNPYGDYYLRLPTSIDGKWDPKNIALVNIYFLIKNNVGNEVKIYPGKMGIYKCSGDDNHDYRYYVYINKGNLYVGFFEYSYAKFCDINNNNLLTCKVFITYTCSDVKKVYLPFKDNTQPITNFYNFQPENGKLPINKVTVPLSYLKGLTKTDICINAIKQNKNISSVWLYPGYVDYTEENEGYTIYQTTNNDDSINIDIMLFEYYTTYTSDTYLYFLDTTNKNIVSEIITIDPGIEANTINIRGEYCNNSLTRYRQNLSNNKEILGFRMNYFKNTNFGTDENVIDTNYGLLIGGNNYVPNQYNFFLSYTFDMKLNAFFVETWTDNGPGFGGYASYSSYKNTNDPKADELPIKFSGQIYLANY